MKSESDEYKTKFGILVEDDISKSLDCMEASLQSLLVATKKYKKGNVGVLMSYGDHERPISETLHLSNYYSTEGLWCRGCNQNRSVDVEERESTLFQQLIFADYFVSMKTGQTVPENFFTQMDKLVRSDTVSCFGFGNIYAVLKNAVRNYYYECGDYKKTEKYIVENSKSKGLYKKL